MAKNSLIITIVVVAVLVVAGIIAAILITNSSNEGNTGSSGVQVVDNGSQQTGNAGTEGSGTGADSSGSSGGTSETPQTYSIDIANFAFSPSEIRIKVGDTIVWTNKDNTRHTVTSDLGSELGSALLSDGESYSHTFSTIGTFSYHCAPHPYMKGKIIVE